MGKRIMRLMVPALAGMLALSLGTANAALSLQIDTQDGAVLWSLPDLPEVPDVPLAYPDSFPRTITGSATFDGTEAIGISYELLAEENGDTIVMYGGAANLTCGDPDESGVVTCSWSAKIPFTFGPGDYTAEVTASQPTLGDPSVYESVVETVAISIL